MRKLVVTGGCGFIGANLVRLLNAERRFDIRVFDNLSKGSLELLADAGPYRFFEGDVRDASALRSVFAAAEAVVHLAAFGSVVDSVADPDVNFDVNVRGTFNVLSACREAGVRHLVFASTGGALIGNADPPVDESSVPRPISPYGAGKLAGEGYCSAFAGAYGFAVTALRFANVVGPLSWHKKGAVTAFFKAILEDRPLLIYGDGSATRDFLYVDDLCAGILAGLARLNRVSGGFETFHLASGREVSVRQLADLVRVTAGKPDHPIEYREKRAGEVERNFANYDLAKSVLGFEPQHTLEQGLALTWAGMQRQYYS